MTPGEALTRARLVGRLERFGITRHARERMLERNVTRADIAEGMRSATSAVLTGEERWRVEGWDLDGETLAIVVALTDGCVVITVF